MLTRDGAAGEPIEDVARAIEAELEASGLEASVEPGQGQLEDLFVDRHQGEAGQPRCDLITWYASSKAEAMKLGTKETA